MSRLYPDAPRIGVGAVVFKDVTAVSPSGVGVGPHARDVLLVLRKEPPLAGRWSLPGGLVELGESLETAVVREVHEETGIDVVVEKLVALVDHIEHDVEGKVRYHYVLADYRCRYVSGRIVAGSDALEAKWAPVDSLSENELPARALALIRATA